jgi:hypothetical protein
MGREREDGEMGRWKKGKTLEKNGEEWGCGGEDLVVLVVKLPPAGCISSMSGNGERCMHEFGSGRLEPDWRRTTDLRLVSG